MAEVYQLPSLVMMRANNAQEGMSGGGGQMHIGDYGDHGDYKENGHMTSRIMVVDDDSALRMTLEEILMDEGRDVISAEDGLQAVRMASESPIALILMDVQMPGMNGVDAFMEIKEILPECTVVIMTGHAIGALVEKALSEGVMTVLTKPVPIERLLDIVEKVVPTQSQSEADLR